MRVLLDDGPTTTNNLSGIGHHSINLWKHLQKMIRCEVTDYGYLQSIPRVVRRFAYFGIANVQSKRLNFDVVHYQNSYVPFLRGKSKKVVTIYDLSVLKFPETVSPVWRHYNKVAFRDALVRSDAVVAISQSVRNEVLAAFPSFAPDRIRVCPCGIRETFSSDIHRAEEVVKQGLVPFSYFLFVGDLTKRKNLPFLLNAFIKAKEERRIRPETKLVLVGKKAWGFLEFQHLLREDLGVIKLGYLYEESLASLYRFANALVYPSLYEGFGIPIVEAMSQRTPILISNIPTSIELNEAHNRQMLVFDIGDSRELIRHLEDLDESAESRRSQLSYGDLSRYTYEAIAQSHIELYKSVLEEKVARYH